MTAQLAVAGALVAGAVLMSLRLRLALERELVVAALRAGVQLVVVGLLIAAVFAESALAVLFLAVMFTAATLTAGGRMAGVPNARARAGSAIALGVAVALAPLLASGAFATEPRELIPVAGILIGGAMAATSLAGRRMVEDLRDGLREIEARLLLGDSARAALVPAVRRAVTTAMVPVIDQTRTVGLVALPGTFVGLILGGAEPEEAARLQLVVLLSLLGVGLVASTTCAALVARASIHDGERVVAPPAPDGARP